MVTQSEQLLQNTLLNIASAEAPSIDAEAVARAEAEGGQSQAEGQALFGIGQNISNAAGGLSPAASLFGGLVSGLGLGQELKGKKKKLTAQEKREAFKLQSLMRAQQLQQNEAYLRSIDNLVKFNESRKKNQPAILSGAIALKQTGDVKPLQRLIQGDRSALQYINENLFEGRAQFEGLDTVGDTNEVVLVKGRALDGSIVSDTVPVTELLLPDALKVYNDFANDQDKLVNVIFEKDGNLQSIAVPPSQLQKLNAQPDVIIRSVGGAPKIDVPGADVGLTPSQTGANVQEIQQLSISAQNLVDKADNIRATAAAVGNSGLGLSGEVISGANDAVNLFRGLADSIGAKDQLELLDGTILQRDQALERGLQVLNGIERTATLSNAIKGQLVGLAYEAARAEGQTGRGLSDQDFNRQLQRIGQAAGTQQQLNTELDLFLIDSLTGLENKIGTLSAGLQQSGRPLPPGIPAIGETISQLRQRVSGVIERPPAPTSKAPEGFVFDRALAAGGFDEEKQRRRYELKRLQEQDNGP